MREIKFRGWLAYDEKIGDSIGCMEYNVAVQDGCLLQHGDSGSMNSPEPYCDKDDRWIIQQYTGLKDIHGTYIYEGDVVFAPLNEIQKKFEVTFNCGCFRLEYNHSSGVGPIDFPIIKFSGIEIIGTIHENPELLSSDSQIRNEHKKQ